MDKDVEIAMNELRKVKKPARKQCHFDFMPPFVPMTREEVESSLRISRSKIYEMINPNSERYCPDFPKPLRWGMRSVMWKQEEIAAWMNSRERTTDAGQDDA